MPFAQAINERLHASSYFCVVLCHRNNELSMATPVPKITEELHTHLMCPIHLDIFKNPKTLPCQHVVCEECIAEWIKARGGELFCPECHLQQPLPLMGAKGLPNNFKIASLCEFVEALKVQAGTPEVAACEKHLTKPVAKICMVCTIPVCDECVQHSHNAHKTIAIEEFLKVMGDPLPKLIGQAKHKLNEIFVAVEVLEKTRKELRENHALAKRESTDHVHKMMKIIQQAHTKLSGEIEKMYNEKEAALISQLESLSRAREEISELLSLQEQSNEDASLLRSVMTASGQQLWNKLNHHLTKEKLQLAPSQNSLISISWDKDVDMALQKEVIGTVVTKAVASSRHSALSLSSSRADVQSEVKIQVAMRDPVGSPVDTSDLSPLTATVSAPGGFEGHLQFTPGEGMAEAFLTPKFIGKYKIEAQLFGSNVKNSPLNFIAKPRGNMKINEKQSFNNPHDIIKHDDNFYITNKGSGQVLIMDKQFNMVGKFLLPSDPALQKFDPYSIAHTGKTFVVTDLKNRCVMEFINSTYLQRFGQGELSQPTGIACDKTGKVFVADGQKNCIHVFDQLREHIAILGSQGTTRGQFRNPWFIDVNSKGEVVVADCGNHRVQVIDPNKDEVTKLIDVHHNQKMWDVRGLAVDRNDNIFITVRHSGNMRGWSTEKVLAYSPDGVMLGSFGEGFNYVRGMTITEDEDNTFAFVVDGANHRIKGYLL